jgi:hypothetical protein
VTLFPHEPDPNGAPLVAATNCVVFAGVGKSSGITVATAQLESEYILSTDPSVYLIVMAVTSPGEGPPEFPLFEAKMENTFVAFRAALRKTADFQSSGPLAEDPIGFPLTQTVKLLTALMVISAASGVFPVGAEKLRMNATFPNGGLDWPMAPAHIHDAEPNRLSESASLSVIGRLTASASTSLQRDEN